MRAKYTNCTNCIYAIGISSLQENKCVAWNIDWYSIKKSFQILKEFNPRIHYREVEYSAEYIFTKILEHWHMDIPIQSCIETFGVDYD